MLSKDLQNTIPELNNICQAKTKGRPWYHGTTGYTPIIRPLDVRVAFPHGHKTVGIVCSCPRADCTGVPKQIGPSSIRGQAVIHLGPLTCIPTDKSYQKRAGHQRVYPRALRPFRAPSLSRLGFPVCRYGFGC